MTLMQIPQPTHIAIGNPDATTSYVPDNTVNTGTTVHTGELEVIVVPQPDLPDVDEKSPRTDPAVQNLEARAMQHLAAGNDTDLRAAMFVEFMEIADKPIEQRTAEDQDALNWLANKVKSNRIEAAEIALNEYEKWKPNPWAYEAPDGFEDYKVGPPANSPVWWFTTPDVPPIQDYGKVAAYADLTFPDGQTALEATLRSISRLQQGSTDYNNLVKQASSTGLTTTEIAAITGASLTVVGATAAGLATSALIGTTAFTTLFPFATATAAAVASTVNIGSFVLSSAGPAAIILGAATAAVLEGIDVFEKAALPGKLQEEYKNAYNAPLPDIAELLKDETGAGEVYATFVEATLNLSTYLAPNYGSIGYESPSVYDGTEKAGGKDPEDLKGTNGNDTLDGADGNDTLAGNGGSDKLYGWTGEDIINGGDGNDILYGESGVDRLKGGYGNDALIGGEDNDFLYGEFGNDYLFGNAGSDNLFGDNGDDHLLGEEGNDYLAGDVGNDELSGGNGNDYLIGYFGADKLSGGNGDDTLIGGEDNDDAVVYTGQIKDYAVSFASDGKVNVIDKVSSNGNDGTDILDGVEQIQFAGSGLTRIITGGAANDNLTNDKYWSMMFGGDGNDTITAAYGDDTVDGANGNDLLKGGSGNDMLTGGAGFDAVVYAGQIKDYAVSFASDGKVNVIDKVSSNGNDGTDILNGVEQINFAGEGATQGVTRIVTGTAANDNLTNDVYWSMMFGGDGNDTITAAYGNDTLIGGNGSDLLSGSSGNDILTGGTGADKFVFNSVSEGIDVIKDFKFGEKDKIQINGSSFGATSTFQFSFNSSNGALSFGGQQFATLENAGYFTNHLDITIV